jgi:enoyl-CoA hydratase
MNESPVQYELNESVATITMDDGKANVMSEDMQAALAQAFDRAEADRALVILTGRTRIFSGGYDRAMFGRGQEEVTRTIRSGGALVQRIFGYPRPVIAVCNGHAVAQGAFLLLASDVRIGAQGDFKIGLNEVAIGLIIPHYGVEIARYRLTAPYFDHATATATMYSPDEARTAGFLDRVVDPSALVATAREEAKRLLAIDSSAHLATKQRARRHATAAIRDGIQSELGGS